MPALEHLAREGVVFDQATSVAPLTLPAHCSLFTGLLPPSHGVRDNADSPLAPEHATLAEVLAGKGFQDCRVRRVRGASGGSRTVQGFEFYRSAVSIDGTPAHPRQRRGDHVMKDAIAWLDSVRRSQFFLWVHLYDPHRPCDPPEPFRSRYGDPPSAKSRSPTRRLETSSTRSTRIGFPRDDRDRGRRSRRIARRARRAGSRDLPLKACCACR